MISGILSRHAAERLVEAATAAPSLHNTQPWRFVARLAERVIEIYADPVRTPRRGDPRGRAVHIACGAALFNLRLAAAHAGATPVARLLPNPRNPLLLASVRLAGPYRPRPAERDLYTAIGALPRSRSRTGGHPPRATVAALAEAAALEGASFRLLEQPDAGRILQSVAAAERVLHSAADLRRSAPGIPGGATARGRAASIAVSSQLALISTLADDRASWLRAGQAAQRVLLLAAHHGLAVAPLIPVPELPDVPLRPDPRLGAGHPELILRLGGQPDGQPPAFRRPVAQVMRVIVPVAQRQDEGPRPVPRPALPPAARELIRSK
jgi:nitroreductase